MKYERCHEEMAYNVIYVDSKVAYFLFINIFNCLPRKKTRATKVRSSLRINIYLQTFMGNIFIDSVNVNVVFTLTMTFKVRFQVFKQTYLYNNTNIIIDSANLILQH